MEIIVIVIIATFGACISAAYLHTEFRHCFADRHPPRWGSWPFGLMIFAGVYLITYIFLMIEPGTPQDPSFAMSFQHSLGLCIDMEIDCDRRLNFVSRLFGAATGIAGFAWVESMRLGREAKKRFLLKLLLFRHSSIYGALTLMLFVLSILASEAHQIVRFATLSFDGSSLSISLKESLVSDEIAEGPEAVQQHHDTISNVASNNIFVRFNSGSKTAKRDLLFACAIAGFAKDECDDVGSPLHAQVSAYISHAKQVIDPLITCMSGVINVHQNRNGLRNYATVLKRNVDELIVSRENYLHLSSIPAGAPAIAKAALLEKYNADSNITATRLGRFLGKKGAHFLRRRVAHPNVTTCSGEGNNYDTIAIKLEEYREVGAEDRHKGTAFCDIEALKSQPLHKAFCGLIQSPDNLPYLLVLQSDLAHITGDHWNAALRLSNWVKDAEARIKEQHGSASDADRLSRAILERQILQIEFLHSTHIIKLQIPSNLRALAFSPYRTRYVAAIDENFSDWRKMTESKPQACFEAENPYITTYFAHALLQDSNYVSQLVKHAETLDSYGLRKFGKDFLLNVDTSERTERLMYFAKHATHFVECFSTAHNEVIRALDPSAAGAKDGFGRYISSLIHETLAAYKATAARYRYQEDSHRYDSHFVFKEIYEAYELSKISLDNYDEVVGGLCTTALPKKVQNWEMASSLVRTESIRAHCRVLTARRDSFRKYLRDH